MTERSDNDRKGVTPDEIKLWTPEEALKIAAYYESHYRVETDDLKAVFGALRYLAGQVEKLTEQYRLSHIDWVNTEKELAEARAEIETLKGEINDYRLITEGHCNKNIGEIERITAERDALQAKLAEQKALYDAARSVALDLWSGFGKRETQGVYEVDYEIAAKLANAADQGKRGKA